MRDRLLTIAFNIIKKEIKSFTMTEDQWKRYNLLHPNAKRENHTIIPDKFEGESGKIRMSERQRELEDRAKNNPSERWNVARNEDTHWSTLHKLSSDKNWQVRRAVAQNKNTRALTLHRMSSDPDKDVRLSVAKNKKTSIKTLKKMSRDKDSEVRNAVKLNKRTPEEVHEKMKKRKEESTINFLPRK